MRSYPGSRTVHSSHRPRPVAASRAKATIATTLLAGKIQELRS